MESAANRILKAFATIENFSQEMTPHLVTIGGHFKGICVLPNTDIGAFPRDEAVEGMIKKYIDNYGFYPANFLRNTICVLIPGPMVRNHPELDEVTDIFADCALQVGFERNIAVQISKHAKDKKVDQPSNPAKAVLPVGWHVFYPEAHRVYATWVIRLRSHAPINDNDYKIPYTPPDCKLLNPEELSALIEKGTVFDEYTHEHERAREKMLSLSRIEIIHHISRKTLRAIGLKRSVRDSRP